MGSGFFGGLLQGTVMGAVALAALSLAAPQPQSTIPDAATVNVAPSDEPPARADAPDDPVSGREMGLPVGSEFGRGVIDVTPPVVPSTPTVTRPSVAAQVPKAATAETLPALAVDPVIPVTQRAIPAAQNGVRQPTRVDGATAAASAPRDSAATADVPLRPTPAQSPALEMPQDDAPDLSMIKPAPVVSAPEAAAEPAAEAAPSAPVRPSQAAPMLDLPRIDFSTPAESSALQGD